MNPQRHLDKNNLDNELDNLIVKWLIIAKNYDGKTCKKCGSLQGSRFRGVDKYYCEHITKLIDKKLKKEKEKITMEIFSFMVKDY